MRFYKVFNFRRVITYFIQFFIFRTIKWKSSVDESVPLGEGDFHMPCLLVQTKSDLLSKEEEENMDELNEFSQNNGSSVTVTIISSKCRKVNKIFMLKFIKEITG